MADLNQPGAGDAPATEEDRFAAAVEADRTARAEAKAETAPAPPAAPAPGVNRPSNDRQALPTEGEGRARGPDGKFLPAGATGGKPEPFEGYSALPDAQRAAVDKLLQDNERAKSRAAAAQRDLEASRRRTPQQQRPPQPSRTAPPPVPPQQPRVLPKWDAAASGEYGETFASIEERIAYGEQALGRQLTGIEQKQLELAQQLQETRDIAARFEYREAEERKTHTRARLDELSPSWQKTAGWIDDNGAAVPEDQQVFAPEFDAWLNALSPKVKAIRLAELADDDPDVIGSVFQRFDADYAQAMGWPSNGAGPGSTATPRNPVTERRAAALNDTQRRPNGAGPPKRDPASLVPATRMDTEEAAFAAAVTPDNMKQWRGLRS